MSQSKHAHLKTVRIAAYLMILVITLSAFTIVPAVPIQTEQAIAPENKIDDTHIPFVGFFDNYKIGEHDVYSSVSLRICIVSQKR